MQTDQDQLSDHKYLMDIHLRKQEQEWRTFNRIQRDGFEVFIAKASMVLAWVIGTLMTGEIIYQIKLWLKR